MSISATSTDVPRLDGRVRENKDEWIASFRTLLEQNGIGWCFWPYKKMDATSCIASIKKPAEWDAIISFANHPRTTFEDVENNRPPRRRLRKRSDYLEQIKFRNCGINEGYLKALRLK